MLSNTCTVEHDRPGPDKTLIADSACVNNCSMCHCHAIPHNAWILGRAMKHGVVLEAAVRPDSNSSVVPSKHRPWPNATVWPNRHAPNYDGSGSQHHRRMQSWLLSPESVD